MARSGATLFVLLVSLSELAAPPTINIPRQLLPGTYDLEVQIFGHSNIKQSVEIDDKDMKLELISRKLY